ncbi:MAG: hypothetical protein JSR89_13020 [Proteobacteria bacterium]|nr:hypothetical protein [Pseudomonadota bacterium]
MSRLLTHPKEGSALRLVSKDLPLAEHLETLQHLIRLFDRLRGGRHTMITNVTHYDGEHR